MTRKVNNVWVRGIFSIIIGVLLVLYPGTASIYFVMAIGALFFIPGVVSVVSYLMSRNRQRYFPFMGLGSLLFGLWLLIMPSFFVFILMYILGAVLVLAGLNMLAGLVNTRKYMPVSGGFYVIAILILAAGIVVLFNPFQTAELPFIVLGVSSIVYALFDMFEAYKFRKTRVEIIEDDTIGGPATPSSMLELDEKASQAVDVDRDKEKEL